MCKRNNNDPKTEPWSTPLVTLPTVHSFPSTETTNVRSAKNSVIQSSTVGSRLQFLVLRRSRR